MLSGLEEKEGFEEGGLTEFGQRDCRERLLQIAKKMTCSLGDGGGQTGSVFRAYRGDFCRTTHKPRGVEWA